MRIAVKLKYVLTCLKLSSLKLASEAHACLLNRDENWQVEAMLIYYKDMNSHKCCLCVIFRVLEAANLKNTAASARLARICQ